MIADSIGFALLFGSFTFLGGWLMHYAVAAKKDRSEYIKGKADGYYECLCILPEPNSNPKVADRYPRLSRVK
jgi:hypothetical protein